MRIKKVSQSIPIKAKVVNSYSESEEETYSCDYVNEHKQDKLTAGTGIEITGGNTINNIQGNYSTEEVRIGTWIDGKPLYRKVFDITNPADSNTNYGDVSDLNISTLVHLYGYYSKDTTGKFNIPFYDSDSNYCVMFVNSGNKLRGRFGESSRILEAKVILEYTKTTD